LPESHDTTPKEKSVKLDEVGYWSEIKHEIIKRYATEYSKIVASQGRFEHWYIDAFAGPGVHKRKGSLELIKGSPLHALDIEPPFRHHFFIDLNANKTEMLRDYVGQRSDVTIKPGDCNVLLRDEVFPKVQYSQFRRGLCVLDPYGLHLDWQILEEAGNMKSLEIFLNFPLYDMNLNVLQTNPAKVDRISIGRMDRYWGDHSWYDVVYDGTLNLFGFDEKVAKAHEKLAEAFRQRLKRKAGFAYVPSPIPMRNSLGNTIYYLFFASPNAVAAKIVSYIFDMFRNVGAK
jgi:three-Cys-motif partner protein